MRRPFGLDTNDNPEFYKVVDVDASILLLRPLYYLGYPKIELLAPKISVPVSTFVGGPPNVGLQL